MSLHQKLKAETDFAHKRLESALNLLRDDLTINDYKNILKAFYGFYLPLEKALGLPPVKTLWLENDLNYFGIEKDKLAVCQKIPFQDNESYKMGVRYVLEGSNLGAMVLTNHFEKTLKITPETGLDFFNGHGRSTLVNWKSFLVELETFSESKYCSERHVITGANDTFSLLYDWLIYYK